MEAPAVRFVALTHAMQQPFITAARPRRHQIVLKTAIIWPCEPNLPNRPFTPAGELKKAVHEETSTRTSGLRTPAVGDTFLRLNRETETGRIRQIG